MLTRLGVGCWCWSFWCEREREISIRWSEGLLLNIYMFISWICNESSIMFPCVKLKNLQGFFLLGHGGFICKTPPWQSWKVLEDTWSLEAWKPWLDADASVSKWRFHWGRCSFDFPRQISGLFFRLFCLVTKNQMKSWLLNPQPQSPFLD